VFWCYMYSGEYVFDVTVSVLYIHTGQAEKLAWPRWESNPRPLGSKIEFRSPVNLPEITHEQILGGGCYTPTSGSYSL
jgi:hypothetical protein